MQDFRCAADHFTHDVSGWADVVNEPHRLADQNRGRIEILGSDGFLEGLDGFGQ